MLILNQLPATQICRGPRLPADGRDTLCVQSCLRFLGRWSWETVQPEPKLQMPDRGTRVFWAPAHPGASEPRQNASEGGETRGE